MRHYSRRHVLALGGAAIAGGCSSMPRGAAYTREVLSSIPEEDAGIALVAVRRETLPEIARWPVIGLRPHAGWPAAGTGSGTPVIAPGDRLNLKIWDSEATSLITPEGQQVTQMDGLLVTPSGHVFLPYVEEVHVAGLSPGGARRRLQQQLESIIPSVQVQLDLISGRRNSIDMVSGVANPGTYPMEERNMTLLNMLARAGGVPEGLRSPRVRLMRGGQAHEAALAEIYENPARDIVLRGNDRVIVEADKRNFIALGAAGTQAVIDFTEDRITALRAMAMMAGVNPTRADPRGILVLREYPPAAAGGTGQPPAPQVVFTLDLTTADGLFSAGAFAIRSGDVVLATESPVTSFERVLRLFGSVLGSGDRISNI